MSTRMSRRSVFGAAALLTAAPAIAQPSSQPDADLIHRCQQFAEAGYEAWYRYVSEPDGEGADAQDVKPDFATLAWITATSANTPEGFQAKALACACWNRGMYDDQEDDRDTGTPLLAALLRDMVAPARSAILTRLEQKYGPLPEGYTPDWRWVGRAEA